jgi:hypothetical protein
MQLLLAGECGHDCALSVTSLHMQVERLSIVTLTKPCNGFSTNFARAMDADNTDTIRHEVPCAHLYKCSESSSDAVTVSRNAVEQELLHDEYTIAVGDVWQCKLQRTPSQSTSYR